MKVTPPIDSIYFHQNSDASVLFYVNTHDATNNTRYYRWDYKETWAIVPLFQAHYEYKNSMIIPIIFGSADDISVCYKGDASNQIFISSSANLTQDIITGQQLGGVVSGSEKIAQIYVMQLRQYALTKDGFNYYQNIKTNTEQLGSIFDAQPSTTIGNIHCISSPTDLVIGFVSASTVSSKQFNLKYQDLPLQVVGPYDSLINQGNTLISPRYFPPPGFDKYICMSAPDVIEQKPPGLSSYNTMGPWPLFLNPSATFNKRASAALAKADSLLINTFTGNDENGLEVVGYSYAPKNCVDCRLKGGTNIRPAYFPVP